MQVSIRGSSLSNAHTGPLAVFASKALAFNAGYACLAGVEYDIIGSLDADVSFPPDYLEFLLNCQAADRALGVAGTFFKEEGYDSSQDSFEGQAHVAGGCQLFRRECFEEIGGFTPHESGGVDWIAVTTARMKGWKTRAFKQKSFFHHRRLGTAERGTISAMLHSGEKDYYRANTHFRRSFAFCIEWRRNRSYLAGRHSFVVTPGPFYGARSGLLLQS
jgi:hypothetical protein